MDRRSCRLTLVLAALSLTACSPGTGEVAVEFRDAPAGAVSLPVEVRVLDTDGELVFSDDVDAGDFFSSGDIPLGQVTIDALPLCLVEQQLTAESPTVRLIIDGTSCTVAD